ncbi:MAG: ATP-binding protein [Chitinophagales bacterium]
MKYLALLLLLFSSYFYPIQAQTVQDREYGMPYISYFSPKTYDAHSQNWAITQDKRGFMYFGNSHGILEYDGTSWRLIPTPKNMVVHSLDTHETGQIFVGAQGEIGYLSPDSTGLLQYVSLNEHIAAEDSEFGSAWKTYCTTKGTYFLTREKVFQWDGQRIKTQNYDPPLNQQYGFYVNEKLYLTQKEKGLVILDGEELKPVPGGLAFADDYLYAMIATPYNQILMGTRQKGLFVCEDDRCFPLYTQADDFLRENQLYHGCALDNGQYALATLQAGIVIIDQEGYLQQVINQEDGLPNDQSYYVYNDHQNGLWVALDNGLARIETSSSLSTYRGSESIGNINAITRFKEQIYLATSQGIYHLEPSDTVYSFLSDKPNQPQLKNVPVFRTECWDLHAKGNSLLVATSGGIYNLEERQPKIIKGVNMAAYCFFPSPLDENLLYVGMQNGLGLLRWENNDWRFLGQVPNINESIRSIASTKEGKMWLVTDFRGILQVSLPIEEQEIKRFDEADGLPSARNNKVFDLSRGVVFTTDDGLMYFDEESQEFKYEEQYNVLSKEGDPIKFTKGNYRINTLNEDENGNIWIHAKQINGMISFPKDSIVWKEAPLNRLPKSDIHAIYSEPNGMIWFGGINGLVRHNNRTKQTYQPNFNAVIRSVSISDSIIFRGTYINAKRGASLEQSDLRKPKLAYNNNSLRFTYTSTSYDNPSENQYQYLLENFDLNWSTWNYESRKDYTNLSPGTYRFRVKSKNVYGAISPETVYEFTILRPWYMTWWAYLLCALGLVGIVLLIIRMRVRSFVKQQQKLQEMVDERTQKLNSSLKELKDTQNQLVVQEKLASLGQLTAGIAHEIQNPLNFINNFAELSEELLEDLNEDLNEQKSCIEAEKMENITEMITELQENVQTIDKHGKRIDSIIKNMLRHSRAESGGKTLVDINALTKQYLQLSYHGFRAKHKTFTADLKLNLDENIKSVHLVQQDIGRAFLNIINNALYAVQKKAKHLKSQGINDYQPTIWIYSYVQNQMVVIKIRDNGMGIPKDIREQIFNPFFTTKPAGMGTGLGLSLTYDIVVQVHQGKLLVNSEKGEFTEFIIELPMDNG